MPWASATICRRPGCGKLVERPGYCKDHRAEVHQQYNAERAARGLQTDKWYHTARWQKLRASVLAVEPLCRMCTAAGRVTLAVLVDHIQPVKLEGEFWDRGNLQPLCNHCHEVKSQAEGSRSRRYLARGPAAAAPAPAHSTASGGTQQGGASTAPRRLPH